MCLIDDQCTEASINLTEEVSQEAHAKKVELGKEEIVHHFSCQHLPNHQGYEKRKKGKENLSLSFCMEQVSSLNVFPLYYDKMVEN